MAAAPEQFEGFMIKSTDKWSDFSKEKVLMFSLYGEYFTDIDTVHTKAL